MSKDNLQTIIVSKARASTRVKAEALAGPFARRLCTALRETGVSWRFQQRPVSDFVKGSFRSFPIPEEPGIVLVYGKLKRAHNPGDQRWLQFRHSGDDRDKVMREWDFWMAVAIKIRRARTGEGLRRVVHSVDERGIQIPLIQGLVVREVAARARALGLTRTPVSVENDERIYERVRVGLSANPNPKTGRAKKSAEKKPRKKASGYIKLRSPKTMPDPGPCSWLGSVVEWGWVMRRGESSRKIDDEGNALWEPSSEWMFMWSPKYKAIVSVKRPRNMYRLANVSRHGGAAKMFERFAARPAEGTFEIEVPDVKLQKIGTKAAHIVYRSDKWSSKRKKSDYIHPFEKGVQIYCGPTTQHPEVFICYGGKLTLTERGLVW